MRCKGSAWSPVIPPNPCCCCRSSSSETTNVIPRHPAGGCAAPAQQKKSPLRRCRLAFPRAGIQDLLPTDGRAVAHPALTLCQIPSEPVCRLPAKLSQALGTQECQSHCRAAPHRVPEPGSALRPSMFPPVPLVKESRAASWGLCVADFLASLPGTGRPLPAGWEECGGKQLTTGIKHQHHLKREPCALPDMRLLSQPEFSSACQLPGQDLAGLLHPEQTHHGAGHERPDLGSAQ